MVEGFRVPGSCHRQSCTATDNQFFACRYHLNVYSYLCPYQFFPIYTVEIRNCLKIMTMLERIVDNFKTVLRANFLTGDIEVKYNNSKRSYSEV